MQAVTYIHNASKWVLPSQITNIPYHLEWLDRPCRVTSQQEELLLMLSDFVKYVGYTSLGVYYFTEDPTITFIAACATTILFLVGQAFALGNQDEVSAAYELAQANKTKLPNVEFTDPNLEKLVKCPILMDMVDNPIQLRCCRVTIGLLALMQHTATKTRAKESPLCPCCRFKGDIKWVENRKMFEICAYIRHHSSEKINADQIDTDTQKDAEGSAATEQKPELEYTGTVMDLEPLVTNPGTGKMYLYPRIDSRGNTVDMKDSDLPMNRAVKDIIDAIEQAKNLGHSFYEVFRS